MAGQKTQSCLRGVKRKKVAWTDGLYAHAVDVAVNWFGGTYMPCKADLDDITLVFEYNGSPFRIRGQALANQIAFRMGFEAQAKELDLPTKREYNQYFK